MSQPRSPDPDHPPESVLEELMGAFAEESAPQYNFDDPSIDRILGITDEHELSADAVVDDDDVDVVTDDDEGDGVVPADASVDDAESASAASPPRRTIVIAENNLPDSVYLDQDKERAFHERRDAVDDSGERSTIVIADLDEGGSAENLANSRSGIDPRIRARRISVRRAEGRKRLIWAGVGIGVLVVAIATVAVFASSIFDVRKVSVQGAVYTDPVVLEEVTNDLLGEPVLLVDTTKAEQRLEEVPWVESARVATNFPHTVIIDIRERQPVAAFQGGDGQYRVIDRDGRVLDVLAGQPTDYLLITGDHPDTARGQFAGAPYASVAGLVSSLPAEIRTLTTSVGVDAATGTLTMTLASEQPKGVEVRLGDAHALDEKLARLLQNIRSGLEGVCEIDVSTSDPGVVPC